MLSDLLSDCLDDITAMRLDHPACYHDMGQALDKVTCLMTAMRISLDEAPPLPGDMPRNQYLDDLIQAIRGVDLRAVYETMRALRNHNLNHPNQRKEPKR